MNHLVSRSIIGDNIPILCNQENFILKGNSYRLYQAVPGFHFYINPAVKTVQDNGRPKNGMFICVPETVKNYVKDVSPNHWRVQAVIISSEQSRTLLINSYFPFDTREQNVHSEELTETIEVIQNVIDQNDCDAIVWAGDINAEFKRQNSHSRAVREAVSNAKLTPVWENHEADFTCTYEREGVTHVSLLDHFFLSEELISKVTEAGVIHHQDNSSDHEPIFCVLESLTLKPSVTKPTAHSPRPSWRLATAQEKEQYSYQLDTRLGSIMIPTQVSECKDVHCRDPIHLEACDWYTAEIMEAIQDSAENSLPVPKGESEANDKKKITTGFNTNVKPFKEKALFWNAVWKSAGCPLNCQLHTVMKNTRNRYHYEFKKCVKAEKNIKKSNLLDACLNGNGDLFKQIKTMRKVKPLCADKIDGVTEDIPGHFKSIYEDLYNSVDDAAEVEAISIEVENEINETSIEDVNRVTKEEVLKAAAALKPNKGDPVYSFSSDCVKVKSDLLAEHMSSMIRSFLIHAHIPQFLLLSTLVPIIKDKLGSINLSKNYRSVCITSLILKQIDWIIISLYGQYIGFHDLQFANQTEISANMCTWAVTETISYFLRNGSEVFGCSMDKSKAFDLCKFSILFRKMFHKISSIFLRLIIFMYVNQFANVRFNTEVSISFVITNGVGQGKILAGFAYCFYCYDFFHLLERSGLGCTIDGTYSGAYGYSDDDLLLAPTISALKGMLQISENYCNNHGLKFSTDPDPRKSKTKCIAWLRKPRPLPSLVLCGNQLPWVDRVIHLGVTLTNDSNPTEVDMDIKKARYIAKNIEINQEFHFSSSETKLRINDIYNSSWFGSVIYDLFSPAAVRLESAYNRSVKCMLNLPLQTHRGLIEPLTNRQHLRKVFVRRFLQMLSKVRRSRKPILKTLLLVTENDSRSATGSNLRKIMLQVGKYDVTEVSEADAEKLKYHVMEDAEWKIEMLEGLMTERETRELDAEEQEWLQHLCCN